MGCIICSKKMDNKIIVAMENYLKNMVNDRNKEVSNSKITDTRKVYMEGWLNGANEMIMRAKESISKEGVIIESTLKWRI